MNETPICTPKARTPAEGVAEEHSKEFQRRKRSLERTEGKRLQKETEWQILFEVLFPDDRPVPSACKSFASNPRNYSFISHFQSNYVFHWRTRRKTRDCTATLKLQHFFEIMARAWLILLTLSVLGYSGLATTLPF
jgi:hypothetical protein